MIASTMTSKQRPRSVYNQGDFHIQISGNPGGNLTKSADLLYQVSRKDTTRGDIGDRTFLNRLFENSRLFYQ